MIDPISLSVELMKSMLKVNVTKLSYNDCLMYEHLDQYILPNYPFSIDYLIRLIRSMENHVIVNLSTSSLLCFVILKIDDTILFIGPYIEHQLSELQVTLVQSIYEGTLPQIKRRELYKTTYTLIHLICGNDIFVKSIHLCLEEDILSLYSAPTYKNVLYNESTSHFIYEQKIMDYVSKGNISGALQEMHQLKTLCFNDLYYSKQNAIILFTLSRLAATNSGCDHWTAEKISHKFYTCLKNTQSIDEIEHILHESVTHLCTVIKKHKHSNQLGPISNKVCAYIETHLEQAISIKNLADQFGITPNYLSKCFRQETGTSITTFMLNSRMERAAILLSYTDTSIRDVAQQVGYLDLSHFSRQFSKYYNVSPTTYRRKNIPNPLA